jgi:hypothetical protein
MKKIMILSALAVSTFLSSNLFAQQMPAANVTWSVNCSLNDDVTMNEAVEWARGRPRDESSPDSVFFRQALIGASNFSDNYDFRVVTYYPSYSEYVARSQRPPSREAQRTNDRRGQYFTCNPASRSMQLVRTAQEGGGNAQFESTLMATRFCRLEEGKTVGDAWQFTVGIANAFRAGGDSSLMQMVTRSFGPVENRTGNAVTLVEVPESPEAFGTRFDMAREGLNPAQGLEYPFTICNFPAMWRTHTVYQAPI